MDWQHDGARLKLYVVEIKGNKHWSRRLAGSEFYFRDGLTYSDVASGCLGARVMPAGGLFAASSPGIFKSNSAPVGSAAALGFFNSRLATFLARTTSPNPMHFSVGYVANLPFLEDAESELERLVDAATEIKRQIDSMSISSDEHIPQLAVNTDGVNSRVMDRYEREVALLLVEALIDSQICRHFELSDETEHTLRSAIGTLAGAYACSAGAFDGKQFGQFLSDDVRDSIREHVIRLETNGVTRAAGNAKEAIPRQSDDLGAEDADLRETVDMLSECHPFPGEFQLESLCHERAINPVDVLIELRRDGQCRHQMVVPAQRVELFGRISAAVLLTLGHVWPNQKLDSTFVPDSDGIVSLCCSVQSPADGEASLVSKLRELWKHIVGEDFATCERVFQSLAEASLDVWLRTEFFEMHSAAFKKRPIAWQLQSGKFTAKRSPAFACLVYYHKLNADTLPKLRSQYVGPLRQRLETELRGIQTIAAEARSDRQEKRRAELDDAIQELAAFDAKLEQVSREGFATPGLEKLLAEEPLDRWCSLDGERAPPASAGDFLAQESSYAPDINDGVRVNIAPLQKAGLLPADVLAKKDLDKAIADRAAWRSDERRWVREGKLPQPGWWPEAEG